MGAKCSPAGRAIIETREGCVLHAYPDRYGNPTVGFGHLIRAGENFGPVLPVHDKTETITREQADSLLAVDLGDAERAIDRYLDGVELTQNQVDALCDFQINLGCGILAKGHTLGDYLRAGDFAKAAESFKLYDHANGVEDKDLLARRLAERDLFLTPDDEAS